MARGTLFLVVGPSGAGKDTLIAAARAARPDLHVPRRVVTRAGSAGGEDLDPVSRSEFARRVAAGGFLLHWEAHALGYGIPASARRRLDEGRDVMANVSRAVIAEARARLAPVRILLVTAPEAVLRSRLEARGREGGADIAERVRRAGWCMPQGPDVAVIRNDGALGTAVAAFLDALAPVRG